MVGGTQVRSGRQSSWTYSLAAHSDSKAHDTANLEQPVCRHYEHTIEVYARRQQCWGPLGD